jgi:ABC-2 type transport system ATP-binding protein
MSATMAAPVVSADGLTKRYGSHRGVHDVSFTVNLGEICALLGRNGAGKTTTLRMLVGLSRCDRGHARLLGQSVGLAAGVLTQVGVVIDGPAFVPHLSGMRNLKLLWRAGGRAWPPPALDAGIGLAGLGSAIDRKVKSYSSGMRQRLMLAQALMGAPRVLVLDEPANGLDPDEVRALRTHLTTMAADGVAVVISSHLLAEVELLASHLVVLDEGAVQASGPLDQLLSGDIYEVEVDELAAAQRVLAELPGVTTDERAGRLLITAPDSSAQELTHHLVTAGIGVRGVRATQRLEDVFLELVAGHDAAR